MKPKINNFYYSMWPIFALSTLVGIFPIIPIARNKIYSPKKFKLITLLYMTLFSCLLMYIKKNKSDNVTGQNFYEKVNAVSNFGLAFQLFAGITMFYTILVVSFFKTDKVEEVMEILYEVDVKLTSIGGKFPYKKYCIYQIVLIISGLLLIVGIACIQNHNIYVERFKPISILMWVAFVYPLIVVNIMYCQLTITVFTIYSRLNMITNFLKYLKKRSLGENEILDRIQALVKVYDMLVQASNKTNRNFDIQLLPSLCNQLFLVAYPIFYLYWMFSEKPYSALCWLTWGTLKVAETISFSTACHIASRELHVVGNSIHKVLIYNNNLAIREKLMMFSHHVLQTKFSYTVCGLFILDGSLLLSVVESSATFIVIMIQFQETISPAICNFNSTLLE